MAEEFDLIVVGGGSAGCAMAGRLAEDGRYRVLLVEAGATDRHIRSRIPALTSAVVQHPDFDWCYKTEPDPSIGGRADVWPGGKRLGGGSAINGMMFIRGNAWDYDHWAELGAKDWDYASVLPYFRRMEDNERGADAWRGKGGPLSVSEGRARYPITDAWIEAAVAAGYPRSKDLNGEKGEGVDYVQVSQRSGMRCSSAAAYVHGSKHRERLEVLLEAQVTKILTEDRRAVGIAWRDKEGRDREIRARHGVVLSAGSMNSPRMLMLSGIGPAAHLAEMGIPLVHDLPGVGRNLQDHVGTHLVNEVDAATLNADARGLRGALQVAKYALGRTGALTTSIAHAQALVNSDPVKYPAPNLQIAFAAFAFDLDAQGKLVLRANPSVSTLIGLMRTSHRGRITLRSADPFAPPRIEHRLLGSDEDIEQIVDGIFIARRIMQQAPIARHVKGEIRPGAALDSREALREYVKLASIPLYHPVGTCKIGPAEDPMAVLDADLRVRGIDGLWVADASIMPSLPSGNTNATSIMIGDKGSDHVLRTLRDNRVKAAA